MARTVEPDADGADRLEGYRTKTELVYSALRDDILAGRYRPGTRVVLSQVAAQFGVSKIPVREAVTRLVSEGWLDNSPHVGPITPELTPGEVHETAVIRSALEGAAVAQAIPHHDDASVAALRELIAQMGAGLTDPTVDFPRLNVDLHAAVIKPCPLAQLRTLTVSMMQRTWRYQTVYHVERYQREAHREHVAIVDAIAARDADRAADLTRIHILDASAKLVRQLERSIIGDEPTGREPVSRGR